MSQSITDTLASQGLTRSQAVSGGNIRPNLSTNNTETAQTAVNNLRANLGVNTANARPRSGEGFNLSKFIATASRLGGFVNPAHFLVYITPPKWVIRESRQEAANNFNNVLPFLCHRTQIPGVIFNSMMVAQYGYSTPQKRPTRPVFEDVQLDFYLDNTGVALNFFTKWLQVIINYDPEAIGGKNTRGGFYNEISYMEDYATQVDIYVFDATSAEILHVKLHDAFPLSVGRIALDWKSSNSISTLPISMTYRTWSSNYFTSANIDDQSLRNLTLGSSLLAVGNVGAPTSDTIPNSDNAIDRYVRNGASILRDIISI